VPNDQQARTAIVKTCSLLWARGLVAGTSGNVSVRLPDGTILVTPTGRSLRDLEPSDIVQVDAAGRPLESGQRATTELPLHLAAYRVRADVSCVVHAHPPYCTAWSKTGTLFPLDTVGASESLGPISFTRYARPGSEELAEHCAEAFAAGAGTIVMERHGVSAVALTLARAFEQTDLAEQTAHLEFCSALLGIAVAGRRREAVSHE
jgi:ribulose-5-phosphate 4-epimerase/fuculose-1-phosphate aldolase